MELEEPTITQETLEQAQLHGACVERLSLYTVGMPLVAVKQDDLMWVEQNAPSLARQLEAKIEPLESLIFGKLRLSDISTAKGSGSGYGYGLGSGDGSGSSDGLGSGYGSGSGDGYGYGSGSGYGYGDRYGYGDGYGYGYIDGYGGVPD